MDKEVERDSKKGCRPLNVGHDEIVILIDDLRERYQQSDLLCVFDMSRSSYGYHRQKLTRVDAERDRLKEKVISMHSESRGAAGARTISGQLKQVGEPVGRFKAGKLLREAGLVSKQQRRDRIR